LWLDYLKTQESNAMKPAELNSEILEQIMTVTNSAVEANQIKLKANEEEQRRLRTEAGGLESRIQGGQIKMNMIREALLISKGIPEALAKARQQIIDKMKRVKRDDILVKTRTKLEQEIREEKEAIKKICDHRFVIGYHSYHGTQSSDYEDSHPGKRLCVVCGFHEYSTSQNGSTQDFYKELIPMGNRLINPGALDSDQRKPPFDIYAYSMDDILESLLDKRVPKWLAEVMG
jgi:hypothetical protein